MIPDPQAQGADVRPCPGRQPTPPSRDPSSCAQCSGLHGRQAIPLHPSPHPVLRPTHPLTPLFTSCRHSQGPGSVGVAGSDSGPGGGLGPEVGPLGAGRGQCPAPTLPSMRALMVLLPGLRSVPAAQPCFRSRPIVTRGDQSPVPGCSCPQNAESCSILTRPHEVGTRLDVSTQTHPICSPSSKLKPASKGETVHVADSWGLSQLVPSRMDTPSWTPTPQPRLALPAPGPLCLFF